MWFKKEFLFLREIEFKILALTLNINPSRHSKTIQAEGGFYPILFPLHKFGHATRYDHTVRIEIRKYEIIFQNPLSYLEI